MNVRPFKLEKKIKPEYYYHSKEGHIVFTEKYHLDRGYCRKSNCIHCPYSTK